MGDKKPPPKTATGGKGGAGGKPAKGGKSTK
jgi:hypothetical protein